MMTAEFMLSKRPVLRFTAALFSSLRKKNYLRGVVVWSVVFTTTMITRLMVQLLSSLVVAFLDKMLHDYYLCLVESGKQHIKEVRRKLNRKTRKQRQLLSESGFVLRFLVIGG